MRRLMLAAGLLLALAATLALAGPRPAVPLPSAALPSGAGPDSAAAAARPPVVAAVGGISDDQATAGHRGVIKPPPAAKRPAAKRGKGKAPSPSKSPAGPGATAPAPVRSAGAIAAHEGTLELNATPADLDQWTINPGWGADCQPGASDWSNGTVGVSGGTLNLQTNGSTANCAEIVSPDTWTAVVVETRVYFSGSGDQVANWPAFWMSGTPWPTHGEIDAAEGLGGCLNATYHFGSQGDPQSSGSTKINCAPGWYTVDIVREPGGLIQVWYNGKQVWQYDTGGSPQSENILFDETASSSGPAGEVSVQYVRVWDYK